MSCLLAKGIILPLTFFFNTFLPILSFNSPPPKEKKVHLHLNINVVTYSDTLNRFLNNTFSGMLHHEKLLSNYFNSASIPHKSLNLGEKNTNF